MNSLSTSSTLSRTNLRVEARRERARRSLLAFTQYTYPHYVADPFHRLLGDALDQVVAGKIRQLMIFAPPQSGKSQLASVHLPAYWLGRYPNKSVIITSYAAELAKSKSRESRTIVEAQPGAYDVFADVFPNVQTARDSRSVNLWQLAQPNRGQLVAAGVDGAITGQGAHLAIIDDPFQTWAEAQSPMTRNHADDWYKGTFRTRVREGGAILLITTRWHPDDLAGRLIGREGDQWTVLRLPAIAETQEERDLNNKFLGLPTGEADPLGRAAGEPLSPSRYSLTALNEIRAAVGSMVWTAAYQGVPRLAEGNRFKRAWFGGIVEAAPVGLTLARYWDKAGTHSSDPGRAGAATAGVLMGKGGDGLIYILNVVQGWYSALERESVIKQTAQLDAERFGGAGVVRIYAEQEPGSGGKESMEMTIRNLSGFNIKKDMPTGDKDTRLEPFAAQCEAGNVRLLQGAWNEAYIEEMCAIPNGRRRDQADASAAGFNLLTLAGGKMWGFA